MRFFLIYQEILKTNKKPVGEGYCLHLRKVQSTKEQFNAREGA